MENEKNQINEANFIPKAPFDYFLYLSFFLAQAFVIYCLYKYGFWIGWAANMTVGVVAAGMIRMAGSDNEKTYFIFIMQFTSFILARAFISGGYSAGIIAFVYPILLFITFTPATLLAIPFLILGYLSLSLISYIFPSFTAKATSNSEFSLATERLKSQAFQKLTQKFSTNYPKSSASTLKLFRMAVDFLEGKIVKYEDLKQEVNFLKAYLIAERWQKYSGSTQDTIDYINFFFRTYLPELQNERDFLIDFLNQDISSAEFSAKAEEHNMRNFLKNFSANYPKSYKSTIKLFKMAREHLDEKTLIYDNLIHEIDFLKAYLIAEGWKKYSGGTKGIIEYINFFYKNCLPNSTDEKDFLIQFMNNQPY